MTDISVVERGGRGENAYEHRDSPSRVTRVTRRDLITSHPACRAS